MSDYYLLLIPGLPLANFLILGIWGKKMPPRLAGNIGTLGLLIITCLSIFTAFNYFGAGPGTEGYQAIQAFQFNWLQFKPGLSIDMGLVIDPISVMMLVVVSVVSLMVHIFSMGYMKGEERFATYYAYLSLFTFSMLGLVVSSNLFQLYMFWELVGVSSYLLIGFYFTKASAIAASKKAFIVTRFADFGFLIGILILGLQAGSFDFGTIIQRLTETGSPEQMAITAGSFIGLSTLTWALVLVFIGGAGKSAMFPLHVWLPDAMEGPTPVSALIHAATMVVAGVFLVARLFPLFYLDQTALNLVTWVGLFSALFAAIIACTQTDIKRILAYSTMSQIGFMMFALGVSGNEGESGLGYTSSMFHLFTHAFFKSLLFLGAGAIIHLVHSNEIKDMGGLRKYMPVTHATFLIGCLAIAGVPPFAGFFSKEGILLASWQANKAVFAVALITSAITAFYMFRLYFSIFWSKEIKLNNLHGEGPLLMKIPLVLLAAGAMLTGFIPFSHFVTANGKPFESHLHVGFSVAPVLLALAGIGLAWSLYQKKSDKPTNVANVFGKGYKWAYHKFYIDEVYVFITKKIIFNLIGRPAAWIDRNIVDGLMNGLAVGTAKISETAKGLQSGRVQAYALVFFGGLMALAAWLIFGGKPNP